VVAEFAGETAVTEARMFEPTPVAFVVIGSVEYKDPGATDDSERLS
jgi:hypothetical protein